jgi:hypothetical protein
MIHVDNPLTSIDQIPISDADTYFKWVAPDTLELYVNGVKVQSWTAAFVAPDLTGQPYGLLLTLTHPA